VWSDVSVQPSTPSRRGALCENLPKFGRLHSIRRGTHCGDRGAPKGRVKQLRMHGNRAHEGLAHRDPTRPDRSPPVGSLFHGKIQGNSPIWGLSLGASAFGRKFNRLPIESKSLVA